MPFGAFNFYLNCSIKMITAVSSYSINSLMPVSLLVEFIFNGRYFWSFMCLSLRDALLLAICQPVLAQSLSHFVSSSCNKSLKHKVRTRRKVINPCKAGSCALCTECKSLFLPALITFLEPTVVCPGIN